MSQIKILFPRIVSNDVSKRTLVGNPGAKPSVHRGRLDGVGRTRRPYKERRSLRLELEQAPRISDQCFLSLPGNAEAGKTSGEADKLEDCIM